MPTTRRSEAKLEALLSVCHEARKKSFDRLALAATKHWVGEGAKWEAEAAAASARESTALLQVATLERQVASLSAQNRMLARQLSVKQVELALARPIQRSPVRPPTAALPQTEGRPSTALGTIPETSPSVADAG